MDSFFIYREPLEELCHCYTQKEEPSILTNWGELNGHKGFVIAPFSEGPDHPICLLDGESGSYMDVPLDGNEGFQVIPDWQDDAVFTQSDNPREDYHHAFTRFHGALKQGIFRKLVLARSVIEPKEEALTPRKIFLRACKRYPRQYVALFYTPQTGMWLVASPEILLHGNAGGYQTMALAGTMKYEGEDMKWSAKNQEEQRLVADYIRNHSPLNSRKLNRIQPVQLI